MSILPNQTIDVNTIIDSTITTVTLPMFREYAWDYDNNDFLLSNGKFVIIEGLEAVKVWIYKALQTQRYRYLAYSFNYGNELENLVGQNLNNNVVKLEAQRYIEEALLINPYIESISGFSISFDDSKLSVNLTANTLYGEVNVSV